MIMNIVYNIENNKFVGELSFFFEDVKRILTQGYVYNLKFE